MGKLRFLKDTMSTMGLAIRYSYAFCMKYSRGDTIGRICMSLLSTVLVYTTIQSTGLILNAVQKMAPLYKDHVLTVGEFVDSGILWPLGFMLAVLIVGVVHNRLTWYFRSGWSNKLRYANMEDLNEHRATLDVACFNSKRYDDLKNRIQELPTSWQTRMWFGDEMLSLFAATASFVIFGSTLLVYKPSYAFIILLSSLPMMWVEFKNTLLWWTLYERLNPLHKHRSMLERPYHDKDAFGQALMFNQMSPLRRLIDVNTDMVIKENRDMVKSCVNRELGVQMIGVLGLIFVIGHAVWSTLSTGGAFGTLAIIIGAAKTFQGSFDSIVSLIANQWNIAKGVILIEHDFKGLKPLVQTPRPIVPEFKGAPEIEFNNVSFAYPEKPEVEVLKNVSFNVKPGTKVAIVGPSGKGKSTIMNLILRHYDPTKGSITANGYDLQNIEPNLWREYVTALTQDYTVLSRKVGDEIASSRLNECVEMDKVVESAILANFDSVISDDANGYNSQIGTEFGGREFSGGERQRLALARVLYRGTPIFIFDEPDAKLDPESAEQVINNVLGLEGVTVIMITHHVSRAEKCDHVIVMGKGEVLEEGTHEELMAMDGQYVKMFQKDRERLYSSKD